MATNISYMQPLFDQLSQGVQIAQHLRQAALQQQLDEAKRAAMADAALRQHQQDLGAATDRANMISGGAQVVQPAGRHAVSEPYVRDPTTAPQPSSVPPLGGDPGDVATPSATSFAPSQLSSQLTHSAS